jgi:ATP:ADP antiporter, AAA family
MSIQAPEFGKMRSFFWPIHGFEVKKVLPMALMLFLICFDYSILRNLKDAIVVTAKASGAEVIPFIKVWVLLPMAIILTLVFTRLSNRYSQQRVFYVMISGFLLFFALFGFVLFPLTDTIHPHDWADSLESALPAGFKGFVAMCRNWSFTLFYVFAELWSSMVMTVLFWGLANEVTKINEARRFYSVFGVFANAAAITSGQFANYMATDVSWAHTLDSLLMVVIAGGCATMAIFWWLNKNVFAGSSFAGLHEPTEELKKKKKKLSMRESFSYLSNSKYLLCIAVMVVAYNLTINLVEVIWKDQLSVLFSSPKEYNAYMNNLTSIWGLISTTTAFCMSFMIGRFGWTKIALLTPAIMLITSAGFFSFIIFRDVLSGPMMLLMGMSPLAIAVFFGSAQVCLSKAAKYSVFDATKEMAFIPLDHQYKLKGKAAIDGVGSRFGKSGGSLVHQGMLMFFGTLSASAPYVGAILLAVVIGWIIAVKSLGRQFAKVVSDKSAIGEEAPVEVLVEAPKANSLSDIQVVVAG